MADAIAQCLVRLALDDNFRQRFNSSTDTERAALLQQEFPEITAIDPGVRDALAMKSIPQVAEHLFSNQQTSGANSIRLTRAVNELVAAMADSQNKG